MVGQRSYWLTLAVRLVDLPSFCCYRVSAHYLGKRGLRECRYTCRTPRNPKGDSLGVRAAELRRLQSRSMNRRKFLRAGTSVAIGTLAASRLAFGADAEIVVSPGEPGELISPHIYGHFIEHLGGVIYDGVWVGPDSRIPNVKGIRK